MGFNTTVVILNDALGSIEEDKDFGKKIAEAVSLLPRDNNKPVEIPSGWNANAAYVIECHHADSTAIIAVGGNCGEVLAYHYGYRINTHEEKVSLLRTLAKQLGCDVVEKKKKPKN